MKDILLISDIVEENTILDNLNDDSEFSIMRTNNLKKALKILKRKAPDFVVLSRRITTVTGGKAKWGGTSQWTKHQDNAGNIGDAIKAAQKHLLRTHIGTIIYIVRKGSKDAIPIYECKWGHDGKPYMAWKQYSVVADYWRRKIER